MAARRPRQGGCASHCPYPKFVVVIDAAARKSTVKPVEETRPAQGTESTHAPGKPLRRVEVGAVGLILLLMVAIPAGETLARRLFGRGFPGSGVLVQHL